MRLNNISYPPKIRKIINTCIVILVLLNGKGAGPCRPISLTKRPARSGPETQRACPKARVPFPGNLKMKTTKKYIYYILRASLTLKERRKLINWKKKNKNANKIFKKLYKEQNMKIIKYTPVQCARYRGAGHPANGRSPARFRSPPPNIGQHSKSTNSLYVPMIRDAIIFLWRGQDVRSNWEPRPVIARTEHKVWCESACVSSRAWQVIARVLIIIIRTGGSSHHRSLRCPSRSSSSWDYAE